MRQPQSTHDPREFSGRSSPAQPPSEGSKLSSITLCQQSSNSALPANKCSFFKDEWDGKRWTQSRLHLFSWKTHLPHMQIHITQLKKLPLRKRNTSPASAAGQSCAHYQQPVVTVVTITIWIPPYPKWPVQTQVLQQCASVSHGRESLTLQQYCTLKSAHYPATT